MHTALNCPTCGAAKSAAASTTISDSIIASGNVIFVAGIDYAAFESHIRPVFSQMPIGFENLFGACFARYRSGFSHPYDFTLVVAGEDNPQTPDLLRALLPRLNSIVFFGPAKVDEADVVRGVGVQPARSTTLVSSIGVEDWDTYYKDAMKLALKSLLPDQL